MALYDYIADLHALSHEKPDREHSHLPTVLSIARPKDKTIVDVGCGSGFFTHPLAFHARQVYGIDWSIEQIDRAKQHPLANIQYEVADMRTWSYPESDVICVPYILNTTNPLDLLQTLKRMQQSLRPEGKLVSIVDMPQSTIHDNRQFGSRKLIHGSPSDESNMDIELYQQGCHFLTLHAFYYPRHVFEQAALHAGFRSFRWHRPRVSAAGIEKHGEAYWEGYLSRPDVAYFSATK